MVAFMHTGTRLTAGYRYTTLGDATMVAGALSFMGHFKNCPPTSKEWYGFLGCAAYTFQAEDFERAHSGNWGKQRGNTHSGISSVLIARDVTNEFVTGWAGK